MSAFYIFQISLYLHLDRLFNGETSQNLMRLAIKITVRLKFGIVPWEKIRWNQALYGRQDGDKDPTTLETKRQTQLNNVFKSNVPGVHMAWCTHDPYLKTAVCSTNNTNEKRQWSSTTTDFCVTQTALVPCVICVTQTREHLSQ